MLKEVKVIRYIYITLAPLRLVRSRRTLSSHPSLLLLRVPSCLVQNFHFGRSCKSYVKRQRTTVTFIHPCETLRMCWCKKNN